MSMIVEENPQSITDWSNLVRSIAQQRRIGFPIRIMPLSFSYRRFCLANGYVSAIFPDFKEDPDSIPNDFEEEEEEESDNEVFGPAPFNAYNGELLVKIFTRSFEFTNLAILYAMVGLHRYNMLYGTNWDLYDLKKVTRQGFRVSIYFITLVAYIPTFHVPGKIGYLQKKTFQVVIEEQTAAGLSLACGIARPLGEGSPEESSIGNVIDIDDSLLGHWPSKRDVDDEKRFYVLERKEWLDSNDWIYFYLHLVATRYYMSLVYRRLIFEIEIVEVAIKSLDEQEVEPLKAKSAVVYIKYKDWEKADCKAIFRRDIDKGTGLLSLLGWISGFSPLEIDEQPSMTPQW